MEMKFDGEFRINQPRDKVFEILRDPEKFAPLLPTFHSMEMKDSNRANLKLKVGIGRITATATTELILEEALAPSRIRYTGQGKVMQGAYQMSSTFELDEIDGETRVRWQGRTVLAGKLLSIAGGGLRSYAEKEINRVITSLQAALAPGAETAVTRAPAENWFMRLLHLLTGTQRQEAAGSQASPATAPDISMTYAPHPAETLQSRKESIHKINRILDAGCNAMKPGRKEDKRLVTGQGLYVDDYLPAGALHMVLVRSPYAHARILDIDVSRAESLPGVICTITGKEIAEHTTPFTQIGPEPSARIRDFCLAVNRVRYQGDPVVAVIAESRHIATDAAQRVEVNYDILPAVVSCEDAQADTTVIHEEAGTNRTWQGVYEYGDVDRAFAEAAHIVRIDHLKFHRFSSTALECNAVVATWDRRDQIDFFCNTIMTVPIAMIAPALDVRTDQIRLRTHDIGGAFGNKIGNYPYMTLAAFASRKAGGAPVKWVETRSEYMQAGGHGGERNYYDTEVALDKDGVITALRSRHVDDCGAYPRYEPLGCVIWSQVLPAAYKLRNVRIDFSQVVTNKGPCAPNRGYSRLPHMWFMERVIDICGHELGIPADEIRLRNYIRDFPYTTPNGCVYDSGDFVAMLNRAKDIIGWDDWKQKQQQARTEGRIIGIGIGTTLDSGTNNFAQSQIINPFLPFSSNSVVSTVKLDLDGSISASVSTFPQGQGHETTTAQVIAEELGVDTDMVHVKTGFDSERNSHSGTCGTYASQFAVTGLSAVHGAVVKLRNEMKKLAAHALEANENDLEFGMGEQGPEVRVIGTGRGVNYWALANMVNYNKASLPEELREISLNVRHTYVPPFEAPDVEKKYGNLTLTYAMQLHIAAIEVDPQTFKTRILDYVIVDDCGKVINPMIVEGQVHGGTAHGLGAALLEIMPFDKDGNVLAGSFTDYAPITINNMPDLKCSNMQTPSPFTYNGAKGMGEGGGAPLHAISAALQDALYDQGVIIQHSHNSPMALHDFIREGRQRPVTTESR